MGRVFEDAKKRSKSAGSEGEGSPDPANDPNMIRVFDKYGQVIFIPRQVWLDDVLTGNIKKAWDDPEMLYALIVQSFQNEFIEEMIPAAERLREIDSQAARSATVLGIAYMEAGRLKKAERVLSGYLSRHGDDGVVLVNLAKVYSRQEKAKLSEQTLWRGLTVDPNQDAGICWYEVLHCERSGVPAGMAALKRVAELPGSWRAQLWLARAELEKKNLDVALGYYEQSLSAAGQPVPSDLLMQMSGDLGTNGYRNEIVEWAEPWFDAKIHGIEVGNNLIKAFMDSGQSDAACRILNQLYSLKRPDWQETLRFWDTELAKAHFNKRSGCGKKDLHVSILDIIGPLWMRDGSPFSEAVAPKESGAEIIGVLGSTLVNGVSGEIPQRQMADVPGRLSRALPLLLAEWLHLHTSAEAHGLIPWAQENGFAVFGSAYSDEGLCAMCDSQPVQMDYVIGVVLDLKNEWWDVSVKLLKVSGAIPVGEVHAVIDPARPGAGVDRLLPDFCRLICDTAGFRAGPSPGWYKLPVAEELSDYLLRLEQQLAVFCVNIDTLKGSGLSGAREIIDGTIRLCVRNPYNENCRMLLVQTLRQMKKAHPDMIPEFQEKMETLQKEFPLRGRIGKSIAGGIEEIFG